MKLQFTFKVVASPKDEKTNVLAITSIMTEDGKRYVLPEDAMYVSAHKELQKVNTFNKVKASLKRRHDKISAWFILTDDLEKTYIDEAGNLEFEDRILQEMDNEKNDDIENPSLARILEKLVEASQKKEGKNLKHIADKLIVEKFNSKTSNAHQWIVTYEKECTRLQIDKEEYKIEILRFFLDDTSQNWYNSMMLKEGESQWNAWKEKFIQTFGNKGWNNRAYAHYYKYKEGSLLDYAIKKEKLLLEINKNMDVDTVIDRIGFGLPENVREKIDRENLENITDLFSELKKHEGKIGKKNLKTKETKQEWRYKNEEKKPCKTCENLNKGARYHPEDKCWFKTKPNITKERPKTMGNNAVIEVDLQDESKNE